jgi:hypothetical protein
MVNSFVNASTIGLMKCVPWSFIRILGHPNLVIMSSNINCVVVVALQSLTTLASAPMVKYSVTIMIYLSPMRFPGGLIGPMKSMAHFLNACRVIYIANGISSILYGIPNLWHTS